MAQKITPFLWFDGQAEEAAKFYTKVFPRSKIVDRMPGPAGKPIGVTFLLQGQRFIALNGGPQYKPTPAVSFYVECATQREVDRYWQKLTASGGEELMCGWLTDKYGFAWQIIPKQLPAWLADEDGERAGRVMQAMLKMRKIDIGKLRAARKGK